MVAAMMEQPVALIDIDDDPEMRARIVRKALKTDFAGWVTYRQGDYIEGSARAKNIGGGEIALLLNRFIAPEEMVSLELDCLTYRGLPIQMTARVESCALAKDRRGFVAIVKAQRGVSQAALRRASIRAACTRRRSRLASYRPCRDRPRR